MAQEKGYAEADPALDINGKDSAHKLAILTMLAFGAGVLLIACVNVASLQIVRGSARQKELAIRAALGAGQRRLGCPRPAADAPVPRRRGYGGRDRQCQANARCIHSCGCAADEPR